MLYDITTASNKSLAETTLASKTRSCFLPWHDANTTAYVLCFRH